MNAGSEGWVERSHAIRSQEQNTTVVLQSSEEHGHDSISFDIGLVALLQEDVSLIQKKNTSPFVRKLKATFEVPFNVCCCIAYITACDGEERPFRVVCNTFCGGCLTNT
jgi:hypothetical protein